VCDVRACNHRDPGLIKISPKQLAPRGGPWWHFIILLDEIDVLSFM
jgi:hypothetical protein